MIDHLTWRHINPLAAKEQEGGTKRNTHRARRNKMERQTERKAETR